MNGTKPPLLPGYNPGLPEPFETCHLGVEGSNLGEIDEFFAGRGEVHRTLERFVTRVEAAGIPYAVMGALAVYVHGHHRGTSDVDVIVTAEARQRIHDLLDGRGFLPPFAHSRNLRDTMNGVKIDLVLAGDYPGDGEPKPVAFPDPSVGPLFIENGIRYVTLVTLIDLKLASGISSKIRYRDLGDVVSLIDSVKLPREFGDKLNPYVQPKWFEIWDECSVDTHRNKY